METCDVITAIDSLFLSMTIFSAFGTVISLAGSVLGCMGTCCARTQVVNFERYICLSLIIFSCSVISFPAYLACELPSSLALQDKFLHPREIVSRGESSARGRTMKMPGSWQTFTCLVSRLVSRAENARPAGDK